jgi:hypothetical protein
LIDSGYANLNEIVASGRVRKLRFSHQPNPMMSLAVSMVPVLSISLTADPMTWVGVDYDDAEDTRFVHYYTPRRANDGRYLLSRGRRVVPELPGRLLAARRSDELAVGGKLGQCIEESALFTRSLLQQFGAVIQSRKTTRILAEQMLAEYSALLQSEERLTDASGKFTARLWSLVLGEDPVYISGLTVNNTYLDCQKQFAVTAARANLLARDRFFWLVCSGCTRRLPTTVALSGDDLEIWAACRRCNVEYSCSYGEDAGLTVIPRVVLDDAFDIWCRHNLGLGVSYPKAAAHLERADELVRKAASVLGIEVSGQVWLAEYDELSRGAAVLLGLPGEADELVSALLRAPFLLVLCAVGHELLHERLSKMRALLLKPGR